MKIRREKTLEDEDIPKLNEEDQAQACYSLFTEKFNEKKQLDPSSQPLVLWTIVSCNWKEILTSGLFPLITVVTLSTGPLILNALLYLPVHLFSTPSLRLPRENKVSKMRDMCWPSYFPFQRALSPWHKGKWARDNRILGGDNSYCALQWPLAKLQHKFQSKLMVAQDDRLKAISEALVNMKVLKLYAWESHFKNVIENLGKVECKWLSAVQMHKAYNGSLFWASPVLVSTATFGACYFLGLPFYASNVFTFVATLRLVQEPVRCIPYVIAVVIQAKLHSLGL
ncbi:ABC transporter C family member 10 [Camellia lanceoleosa]|uniref:ABC transporter C family member 10 n=1 Tax=Camellia lanceoleosa TaxID=1840588 RepID=A0ACC0H4B6_9ERIC|nr:ABC transporter C family member 10 [Camellia lanceoleosa]